MGKTKGIDAPMEVSSKIKVKGVRQVVPIIKKKRRDPRFDDLSGSFNQDLFEKSYAFMEDMKKKENEELKKAIREEKDEERRNKLKAALDSKKNLERLKEKLKEKQKMKSQLRKLEMEKVAKGKRPYFLKKNDEKKLEHIKRFNELESKGKLDDFLTKRRKKNAQKDIVRVP
eukprot:Nk52_evm14s1810 gene=Nk52_evmTU14s1810